MRLSQAKALIVNAYSNEIGSEMSSDMSVDSFLIGAVKYGKMTAAAAASEMISGHRQMCTKEFDQQ